MTPDPKDRLRSNPLKIADFLNEAFKTDDLPTILVALREALRAQNVAELSRRMALRRDRLYKTFGGEIDPGFGRVLKLLEGLEVQITIAPRKVPKPQALLKPGRPRKHPLE
jgi:probable addiction module antidote protein